MGWLRHRGRLLVVDRILRELHRMVLLGRRCLIGEELVLSVDTVDLTWLATCEHHLLGVEIECAQATGEPGGDEPNSRPLAR
jgi:hypothetical protein